MLKKLRNRKTAKKIWIVLTILILPAFVFWGFGSFMRGKQDASYAGKIFGRNVSMLDYADALNAAKNQALIQFGDSISEVEKKINLELLAWDRLLLLAQAKKLKVNAADREVIALIKSYPFFQRKGKFDNQVYSQMLQYVFHTQPRVFEEQTRQSIILSKLYKEITDKLNLSGDDISKEYEKLNEQISLYYISGSPSEFTKEIAPTEEEIKGYFIKNSFQFKEPLSFNIEYISINSTDKSEADIKKILKNLAVRINKKEDFAKAAMALNLQVKETGLFNQTGPIPGIGWSPQVLSLVSKLKIGEFSPAIYVDKYYCILRLKDKKEPYIPDFRIIADKVKEALIKEMGRKITLQKMEDCLNELKTTYKTNPKSIDFNRIAKNYGLKSDSTGLFKYGSYIEGIGASDDFFTAALSLSEEGFSKIIEMPSGFYIIKLKSRVPVDENKFLAEKPEFAKKLLLQKKDEYFSKFLRDLRKNAHLSQH